MGITDEDKDKSGKPPLLPKPCLSSPVAGPGEQVIPQMIISSPDDIEESTSSTPLPPSEPEIVVCNVESTNEKIDPLPEEDKNIQPQITLGKKDGEEDDASSDLQQSKFPTKSSDVITHSVSQRPLRIESDKSTSEEPEHKVDSDSIKSTLTTKQRPLVFDGSKVQSDVSQSESETKRVEILLELNNEIDKENDQIKEDFKEDEILSTETEPKLKSSSFSWMPSFPKIQAASKETRQEEIKDKPIDSIDSHNISESPKKDGMQKFFDSFRHDAKVEQKDKSVKAAEQDKIKESSKESRHSMKKFLLNIFIINGALFFLYLKQICNNISVAFISF